MAKLRRRRTGMRIVRSRDEERLRSAVRRLLANGYDMGQISRITLDTMGVLELVDPSTQKGRRKR
jgi:hypothetical protein